MALSFCFGHSSAASAIRILSAIHLVTFLLWFIVTVKSLLVANPRALLIFNRKIKQTVKTRLAIIANILLSVAFTLIVRLPRNSTIFHIYYCHILT